ncbi:RNA-binding KH domain-containing protein RCF3-like [Rutidosis leptorrhynchoides]|uniref:RNA-binding KH domain-containing protein RCF3-like n=1 Tax=Rutidosis leptorrhynchoides TaxID=125765 RepID=UPI003A98E7AA
MDRSRSKRYYYEHHPGDYDGGEAAMMGGGGGGGGGRATKPRYNHHNNNFIPNRHHRGGGMPNMGGGPNFNNPNNTLSNSNRPMSSKPQQQQQQPPSSDPSSLMVTTTYRILCHDVKAGGVIGKSGSIIKSIRQHSGAWINVHELMPGDEERIIEITDTRRRDPEGRTPAFSPAQEALFLIHDRMMETGQGFYPDDDGVGGGINRVATRLVVNRMHVGCLLGKGGKIIEQMRMETKTQIRVLPRDHTLPRCVSMSEEIVQVVGDVNNVKNAIAIISSRLRESQHRDRTNFHGRIHSPERFFDDDYVPHMNNADRHDGGNFGPRFSGPNYRGNSNNYGSRPSGYMNEAGPAPPMDNNEEQDLVFRMLCPGDKIDRVFGESDGIIELLQNEIGVDVKVADNVASSDERIIIVSSEEGPEDELFPAQEALLHIQTRIVDLLPDKDNIVTTRLIVPSIDIGCLEGRDGSLSEMAKLTGANIQILPREEVPAFVSRNHELLQIVGEIKAAREALMEVTSRLRSHLYREFFQRDTSSQPYSAPDPAVGSGLELGEASPMKTTPNREGQTGFDHPTTTSQNVQLMSNIQLSKEPEKPATEAVKQNNESKIREDVPITTARLTMPLVTRSILEVVIPSFAVAKLSENKVAQISELSGADVTLMHDKQDSTRKTIQIAGSREQAERAQSLLQGFILSIQE